MLSYPAYFDLCLTDDNGVVVLGKSDIMFGGSSIIKIDFSGNVVWSKSFHSAVHGGETNLLALEELSNGNIAIVGSTTEFTDAHGTSAFNTNTIAIMLDKMVAFCGLRYSEDTQRTQGGTGGSALS